MKFMDLRKIVVDRMEELGMKVPQLAAKSKVSATTLWDFCRNPADYKKYDDQSERKRKGNLNSQALGQVFKALDLTVKPLK